jgi:hypothetical protein
VSNEQRNADSPTLTPERLNEIKAYLTRRWGMTPTLSDLLAELTRLRQVEKEAVRLRHAAIREGKADPAALDRAYSYIAAAARAQAGQEVARG